MEIFSIVWVFVCNVALLRNLHLYDVNFLLSLKT